MSDGTVFDERTAADLIKIVRHFRRTGLIGDGMSGMSAVLNPPTPYYVHNDSGETIPAYACMQVTGTEEIGDQNFLLVDKPVDTNGDAGSFLFNGPREIEDNEEGIAQFGPVVRAFKDTGTVTAGEHWIPVSGQWYIAQDDAGQFVAAGLDDVEDDVLRVFMPMGEGSQSAVFVTPSGGIAARSGATLGSATCTKMTVAGGTRASTGTTDTVYNDFRASIGGSTDVIATIINGIWVVIAEDCAASSGTTVVASGGAYSSEGGSAGVSVPSEGFYSLVAEQYFISLDINGSGGPLEPV